MRVASLSLLWFFFAAGGYAQSVRGTVKDTIGKGVPYASVSLRNNLNNTIVAYTITDSDGSYTLKIPVNSPTNNLAIVVRIIGYKSAVKNIASLDLPVDFTLMTVLNQLQEVVVKSNLPVIRTRGDTLSYKVSDFTSPQDRVIGDVIRKLPGITVSADGTISYNNKPVSAVYIGGDNLLDDKYSIATSSIPQGAVNHVQVIQNDQPIKVLQNKVMSNDVALNLDFNKGAKLHLIGEESIGVGLPGNYDVTLNAMTFKNSYKAINYLGGNNVGYNVQKDLLSHNITDYNQRIDNALPATILSIGTVNTPALAENRYLLDKAGVFNLNNLINLKKNVQLKVNAYYVHDTQRQEYRQQTSYFLPNDTVRYTEIQHGRSVSDILHTQATLNINRDKYYLNNALLIDFKDITTYSGLNTDSAAVNQVLKDKTLNISNEFNLIKVLKSNNIIQAYSYISHSAEPENRLIGPGYNAAVFNYNMPYAQLIQNVNIPSWYTNNYFSFKIPSNLITQSFKTGFSVQSQILSSDLNVVQNNNSVNLESDSALNHVNWRKKKLYAEAAYDLLGTVMKANLTLPVVLQQINYSEGLYTLNKNLTRFYFNPQLSVRYQVGTENYMNFYYSYRDQTGTIEDIYPGYILIDYRTLYANNAGLTERKNQQAGGGFSYRKAIKLFFWNINTLYNHIAANNIASNVITNNLQKGIVLPYPNTTDSWIINGSISKYLFALRTTFSGAIQWRSSRSVQLQNNALLPFKTISETFSLNADTKVSDRINFSYKATLTQTYSHSPAVTSAYQVNQLLQQGSVSYIPVEALQFKLSGEHYFTRQQGNSDLKYFFADVAAKFRLNKWKTDFELTAVNLLNVKTYDALYLSTNTLTVSSYELPGRIVLLKVMFNL
ncbi:carboxypeptidase-like regulatory domain-containing protein [Mucilaginibacter sp. RCC_168]|uniref:carboxypeptidase-like regulatory domain-containing protein n=1 Tax=Mucilaginibacter sp. RCC_168 TaxID=3239221 RepID=UPI00352662DC